MSALARLAALRASGTLSDAALEAIDRACEIEDDVRAERASDRPMGRFEWMAMRKRIIAAGAARAVRQ